MAGEAAAAVGDSWIWVRWRAYEEWEEDEKEVGEESVGCLALTESGTEDGWMCISLGREE